MKVRVYRASGSHMDESVLPQYEEEFKAGFDEIQALKDKGEIDIQRQGELINEMEHRLRKKYPAYKLLDLPTSGKAWKQFILDWGNVQIGLDVETNKPTIIVDDSWVSMGDLVDGHVTEQHELKVND